MKLKEFWSRNNLDEMQQQTLLNIEARSFFGCCGECCWRR